MPKQLNFNNYINEIKIQYNSPIKIGEIVEIENINTRRIRPIRNCFKVVNINVFKGELFYDVQHTDSFLKIWNVRLENLKSIG